MSKKIKIEKDTRRLIEGISELLKKKGDRYKFKVKGKKKIKEIKKTCVHWIIRKGKPCPTVQQDPLNPSNWKCSICGSSFPVKPITSDEYNNIAATLLSHVNQLQFWAVMMGGDSDDTKLFIRMKKDIGRYVKVKNGILKAVNKRAQMEDRNTRTESSVIDSFGGYSYNS